MCFPVHFDRLCHFTSCIVPFFGLSLSDDRAYYSGFSLYRDKVIPFTSSIPSFLLHPLTGWSFSSLSLRSNPRLRWGSLLHCPGLLAGLCLLHGEAENECLCIFLLKNASAGNNFVSFLCSRNWDKTPKLLGQILELLGHLSQ